MNPDDIDFGVWIKVFVLCIFGLGVTVGLLLFFSMNTLLTRASGAQANLLFNTQSLSIEKEKLITVQAIVDSGTTNIKATDIAIQFDPKVLYLKNINPIAQKSTSLKTYLPINELGKFNAGKVIRLANETGRIHLGAVAADVDTRTITQSVNKRIVLAEFEFFVKRELDSRISYITAHPTHDSIVVIDRNPPVNILNKTETVILTPLSVSSTPEK